MSSESVALSGSGLRFDWAARSRSLIGFSSGAEQAIMLFSLKCLSCQTYTNGSRCKTVQDALGSIRELSRGLLASVPVRTMAWTWRVLHADLARAARHVSLSPQ